VSTALENYLEDDDSGKATARAVASYLHAHPIAPGARPRGPEFLLIDPVSFMTYVRWPNGTCRWQTTAAMIALGFPVPARGLVDPVRSA
jgi:hypothetical protein